MESAKLDKKNRQGLQLRELMSSGEPETQRKAQTTEMSG